MDLAPPHDLPLKSILKKPRHSELLETQPLTGRTRDEGHLETALYHARLIQQRKDTELKILNATEKLLDFPTSGSADPDHPSDSDATLFKDLLKPFQPSDYESLIEERNIDGKCGYALCPRPQDRQDTKARMRILSSRKNETFRIVPTRKLEQWCSDSCARRGLYVKVQLSEEPAWVRASMNQGKSIVLLDEMESTSSQDAGSQNITQLSKRMISLGLSENAEERTAVSFGYGEDTTAKVDNHLASVNNSMDFPILEKDIQDAQRLPPSSTVDGIGEVTHCLVEGYRPRTEFGSRPRWHENVESRP
ncbi:MAG: hypothetical protein M1837_006902 [Sclerophora amabilis]|nr:MAG: hypothetical protein M1837_006902 [Sclerophora amabilis]